ncbi:photosystem I subunit X, chloroplast precursor [Micromonas pusilla CCMP1545]|uniref:Photosystem I subunit X, chloroplast n=2 Tax=Micromonas pusilla TaxID=38833 RepID=C1N7T9_MICPC|nr:photosystem I subunit X, chloroplast precursor [Micromonas pusilla CCMP1545]EEH51590.1 photosystem I subunit X, chloroplast precursor [Micromonas pusilla CCMP1545]|eukprot:XP_003063968.1 photosystem I subunit X, chloroplast precursor [Micromonas pusilla CCMP1545]
MNALCASPVVAPQFAGAKKSFSVKKAAAVKRDVRVKADWSIGSPENAIVCINTAACLFAGRFGLAPTVNKNYGGADSYTMVEAERPRVQSRDPAGFTIVDVAAWGSLAHIISAGEILGQQAKGFF